MLNLKKEEKKTIIDSYSFKEAKRKNIHLIQEQVLFCLEESVKVEIHLNCLHSYICIIF